MRFEIKTGGWILIAASLVALSVIVFALGLFAGYDMARNTAPEGVQSASVFPLPNPPPAPVAAKLPGKSSDELASTHTAPAKAPDKTKTSGSGIVAPSSASALSPALSPSLSMDKNAGPVAAAPSRAVANAGASAPPAKMPSSDAATEEKPRAPKPAVTSPSAKYAAAIDSSPAPHHKPFNIQIDAAMDRSNAEQMTARLQKLGYRAFMVPTDIAGQTWWRVRVGPYQSQEEAGTAEQELRAKYRDTYTP